MEDMQPVPLTSRAARSSPRAGKPSVVLISDEPEKQDDTANALTAKGFDVTVLPTVCPGLVERYYENGQRDMDAIESRIITSPLSAPYFTAFKNSPYAISSESDLREAIGALRPNYVLLPAALEAVEFDASAERIGAIARECGADTRVVSGDAAELAKTHRGHQLFTSAVQDCKVMPLIHVPQSQYCNALGGEYKNANLKFMAAHEPPATEPALFTVRLHSDSPTEFPCPSNITDIKDAMMDVVRECGIEGANAPHVCWRAEPNLRWMDDHVGIHDHESYAYMEDKPHKIYGGDALLAVEIKASERNKIPALKAAVDALIEQRTEERQPSMSMG